jgi:hypothetical protein
MVRDRRKLVTRALILDPVQLVVVDVQVGRIELAIPIEFLTAVRTPRKQTGHNSGQITAKMVRVSWLPLAGSQSANSLSVAIPSEEADSDQVCASIAMK